MAKRLTIAVDIDDVLVDTAQYIIDSYNKTHGTTMQLSDYYSNDLAVWNVGDADTAIKRVNKYLEAEGYTKIPPMPEAVHTIGRLSAAHELHVITGRPDFVAESTERWLAENFSNAFHTVVFTNFYSPSDSKVKSRPKAEACTDIGADVLIDDHLHHAATVVA